MTAKDVIAELQKLGKPSIKKVLVNHGAREPFFGVLIGDLKKIQKRIKKDHALALALYDTGISDAMYLAGLIADDEAMTKKDLQHWADRAYWSLLSEWTVPWVAAGSKHGHELALKWIESKKEPIAAAGWSTLSYLTALKSDDDLDLAEYKRLLARVQKTIHDEPNRVRSAMNHFVIALGSHIASLTSAALAAGAKIGKVSVDVGGTACRVPYSPDAIKSVQDAGTIGKKKKTVKC